VPTVALFVVLLLGWAASIALFVAYRGPFWVLSPLAHVLFVHGSFTILHEASHKNIFRNARQNLGNDLLGMFAGLVLHGAFEQFVAIHLKHHASVNDPENDPDYHARGPLGLGRYLVWAATVPHYFREFYRLKLWRGRRWGWIALPYALITALYAWAFFGGWLTEFLLLYTLPCIVGVVFTVFFFDYLPHHPHADRSRYGNACVYDYPALNWFFMGHSFHIVHHLWPSYQGIDGQRPWYRYSDAYRYAREDLLRAGVRETTILDQLKAKPAT
jgi:beta-carotene hydroxylase